MLYGEYGQYGVWSNGGVFSLTFDVKLDFQPTLAQTFVPVGADTTPPVISFIFAVALSETEATARFDTNENNGTAYITYGDRNDTPSVDQVIAGTDSNDVAVINANEPVSNPQHIFANITTLTGGTLYNANIVHVDASGNKSLLSTYPFDTPLFDITPPVLINPTASNVTQTSVIPKVTTDTAEGIIYMVLITNPLAPPTNQQIKDGTNGFDEPVINEWLAAPFVSGEYTFTEITALNSYTNYGIWFTHEDASGNLAVATSVGFTTLDSASTISNIAYIVDKYSVIPLIDVLDGVNSTLYCVVTPDTDLPSSAQIILGQQSDGSPAIGETSLQVFSDGQATLPEIFGLAFNQNYELSIVSVNLNGVSSNVQTTGFLTASNTQLTNPSALEITEETVTLSCDVDDNEGTMTVVVISDVYAAPDVNQVLAHTDGNGFEAEYFDDIAVTQAGTVIFPVVTGLYKDRNYVAYFAYIDILSNIANLESIAFKTDLIQVFDVNNLNVGEYGQTLRVNFREDISAGLSFDFELEPQRGNTSEKIGMATLGTVDYTNGEEKLLANEYIEYIIKSGDLYKAGEWRMKGSAIISDTHKIVSDYQSFVVLE